MPTVRNLTRITPVVWIPPMFTTIYKLTVERDDGTIDDITDLIHMCEIEDGVTETIGRFEFEMWDPNETYVNAWKNNNIVRYYSDYGTSADTLRFRGRMEKISRTGMKLKITGRNEALFYIDLTVTKQYVNQACNDILLDLISSYSTGYTTTNIESSVETLTVNWYQKPFWEAVQELCTAANFDAYIDKDKDWHFFEHGSRSNGDEAIVHESNMIEISDFANDLTQVRNRIIVYGAEQEGIQIIYTAEDTGSQASYGIKEEIVNDQNVTSYDQAKELGDFRLNVLKNPPVVGEIKGILLASIQPGQKIHLSSPEDNIDPQLYEIISYKHDLIGYTTTVRVSKEPRKISHIFKQLFEAGHKKEQTYANPNEMRYSYNFLFEEDSGTHTSTEITDGVLKLQTGQSSGNWVSVDRTTTSNVSQCYLIMTGETLTGATVQVSGDNGINYQTIVNRGSVTLTNTGTNLVVKVIFSDANTQIQSLAIQYKLS